MHRYLAEVLTGDGCQKLMYNYFDTLKDAISWFKDNLPDRYTLVSVEKDYNGLGFGEYSGTLNYKKVDNDYRTR